MKRLLAIFLLIPSLCCAQEQPQAKDIFYVINDFSGMLSSHASQYLVGNKYAAEAMNVRPNDVYGALSKRPKAFLLTTAPTSATKSLYRYYRSDDTKYTIATYGTKISYYNDSGTETILYANASDSKRWSFITYKDLLIGMNGTDNAKKWDGETQVTANTDGSRTASDLVADLGAPFAELNTGSNLDASSWYQYRVAYYDGSNYTYSTARSNPILTGADVRDISLTDIPLGPTGTTARYVYRTVGNASRAAVVADNTFYKIATISNNTATTVNDAMADATADDDAVPVWSTVAAGSSATPPKSKFAEIVDEKLFVANDPSGTDSGKSTIYWSDTLNPNYFYIGTDYELIRPDDGDEITFIKNFLGILTIGKTRSASKFYTSATSAASWYTSNPFSSVGCVAPYSVALSPAGIIYLSRDGIYLFTGQSSQLISDTVTDKIRDILATNIGEAVGIYHDNRYLLSYTSSESGASDNDRVLILDITRNAYSVDTMNVDSFATFDSGDDFGTLYSGSSGSDGDILAHKNEYSKILYRYQSQFNSGTPDSIYVGGTEDSPLVTLGDNTAWEDLGAGTWADSGSWTWMLHDLTGEWYSPVTQVDATQYDKIYWNESLGATGNITFAVRSGATTSDTLSASWSSEYSDPSGSDISALTANSFLQVRASLSSTSYTATPALYWSDSFVWKLTYKKEGTTGESSILSEWSSGELDFGYGDHPKRIKEVQLYYEGTAGTLTLTFENETGFSYSFNIDLSVNPTDSTQDQYFGTGEKKIFVSIPDATSTPVGRFWNITVSENGTEVWRINRLAIRADVNQYITLQPLR